MSQIKRDIFKKKLEANRQVIKLMKNSKPVLIGMGIVGEVVPNFESNMILTSGAPLSWDEYEGGQKAAILYGAIYEGLAKNKKEAEKKIVSGEIKIAPCHDYHCIGSVTGIYTASMPVFIVEDKNTGRKGYCNLFEGEIEEKLTYGLYNNSTKLNLVFLTEVVTPILKKAISSSGGIDLREIIRRSINMGDELHSRNSAASLLFTRALIPYLLELYEQYPTQTKKTLKYLENDYNFLRLGMAASKALSDSFKEVEHSSIVTAMAFSCKEFAIRVSGTGDQWFRAPLPKGQVKLFEGYTEEDVAWLGGESSITETMGLGGFVQAAALTLQDYSGGSPNKMIRNNEKMYEITIAEHPIYRLPIFEFKGAPIGIDIYKVVEKRITPIINMGVAHKNGGQIGAGVVSAPLKCFLDAVEAYQRKYR